MSAISGALGQVTFASGFAQAPFAWNMDVDGLIVENTGFSPTNNYRTRVSGNLKGWKGSYRCRQPVIATCTISGPSYIANPYAFTVRALGSVKDTTVFAAQWRTFVSVLLDAEGDYQVYVDGTNPLPLPLTTATGIFTVDTGLSYSIPLIIGNVQMGVDVDGNTFATIPWKASAALTATAAPVGGATGAATFQAHTGRTYSGDIIVTSAQISCHRDNTSSEWQIGFQGTGTLTPA